MSRTEKTLSARASRHLGNSSVELRPIAADGCAVRYVYCLVFGSGAAFPGSTVLGRNAKDAAAALSRIIAARA